MGKEHFFLELEPPEERLRRAPHVVIIGGGFAGVRACKALANTEVRVTLIDKRNFNLFQPLLYQVATGLVSKGDVATPYDSWLAGNSMCKFCSVKSPSSIRKTNRSFSITKA